MRLRATLRSGVAAASIVMAAAPPGFAPALAEVPIRPGSPLDIRVAQAEQFSRLEFHWAGGARVTSRRDGQVLTLRFSRDARPDMAVLRQTPPKWLKSAQASHDGGVLTLTLTLADNADVKLGDADGAEYLNLFEKAAPPPAATLASAAPGASAAPDAAAPAPVSQLPSPNRPNPVPASGVVPMTATATGAQVRFDFTWARPLGAAVFRRADAIWIVFDAQARIDLSQVQRGLPQYSDVQAVQGPGWTGVRITTRAPIAFVADAQGSTWSVTLAPYDPTPTAPVNLTQADDDGPVGLRANLSGATGVYWIEDPGAGDRMAVVTALGPAKGVNAEHDLVQMDVLASAQGMAVVPNADDVTVAFDGDFVKLGRPHGLTLSPASAARRALTYAMDAPAPAAMPGLIDDDWSRTGPGGFLARYDALMEPVAAEEAKGQVGPVQAHLGLARFLVGSQLSFEAIGVLNDAIRQHQYLGSDAEFRALRGMARVMAGRYAEAQNDLGVPALADNAAAANWRGYVAAKQSRWADAKREFAAGASAINQFSPYWKTRFGQAGAQASMALGDNGAASAWIDFALANTTSVHDQLDARVLQARLFEAEGYTDKALGMFRALATAASDDIAGPALLHVTKIQYDRGALPPAKAAEVYDQLRYRWRGGSFELETIRTLGQLYLAQGRYREALEALRSAGQRLPDSPEAAQLQADLDAAFRSLFLDGQADGLQPIQALALFYDFKELTPLGSDGDLMVRKLTRRLVDVDLLPQAEDLLKYQVDNRLDGVPKAQVATDLATIYLMDKQPEQALDAINATRSTVLPQALNLQRRIIAARALTGLGRYDDASEMLGTDPSPDANDARAEIAWRQKSWAEAGGLFEKMLGERYKLGGPLSADDEGKLLRAGVAFSLAGDDAGLGRLREHYGPYVDSTRNPDALRVALTGIAASRVSVADLGRITADNQAFSGWVAKMKDRFRNPPPPLPAAPVKQAAATAPATKG
ncbi:tetratricopeptide repeat protein [Caulobacter sp. KR2-114]|uniref:tetratricopeptide repeat protein n=1 Tax=Caulobacter sp. KR2-114 TaxID=3400912 RepID=UPI003C0F7B1F